MSDVETFYCLIVGSRSFSDYELFVAKCDLLLRNWGSVVIVSGGARGADALAKRYAVDRGYCYMEFPADWDTYGRRAGYIRNRAMHEYISTHEPMKTAVSSRFGTERVVEPARAFRLPDRTPTRLGLSMCL